MNIVYSLENVPVRPNGIFLAGPTLRNNYFNEYRWRAEACLLLLAYDFKGDVYVPEYSDGKIWNENKYDEQCSWEHEAMAVADTILFWVPRDLKTLPGFTTNVEFGYWMNSSKRCLYGRPDGAPNTGYLDWLYRAEQRGNPFDNLESLIQKAVVLT